MKDGEVNDDRDWNEEVAMFDTASANDASRIMWLQIGEACREWALGGLDCLEEPEYADRAIAYAARAEACFWRAAGDTEAIDLDRFLPAPETPQETEQ